MVHEWIQRCLHAAHEGDWLGGQAAMVVLRCRKLKQCQYGVRSVESFYYSVSLSDYHCSWVER